MSPAFPGISWHRADHWNRASAHGEEGSFPSRVGRGVRVWEGAHR